MDQEIRKFANKITKNIENYVNFHEYQNFVIKHHGYFAA